MQTQINLYETARRQIADGDQLFLELVSHPTNPITRADLEALIARRPERWSRFAGWLKVLP